MLRDMILKADDLPREAVPTPEWKGTDGQVFCRRLSGGERDRWELFLANNSNPLGDDGKGRGLKMSTEHIRATLVAQGTCDENGKRIFSDKEIPPLSRKNGVTLDRLYEKIRELSGMNEDEDAAVKNLNETAGDSSSTASPDT